MDMVKIAMLGITGVLIGLQFKSGKQEYSAYIGIGVSLVIFFYVCEYLMQMKDSVLALGGFLEGSGAYFGILFKDRHYLSVRILRRPLPGCRISGHCRPGGAVREGDCAACGNAGAFIPDRYHYRLHGLERD